MHFSPLLHVSPHPHQLSLLNLITGVTWSAITGIIVIVIMATGPLLLPSKQPHQVQDRPHFVKINFNTPLTHKSTFSFQIFRPISWCGLGLQYLPTLMLSTCPLSSHPSLLNPLNAELNSICSLLALLGAHHILHVSRIKVNHANTI